MSYRIYLQTAHGGTLERTATGSRSIAEAVFRSFLGRDELDGNPVSLHLVHIRSTLAVHRFDAAAGPTENWHGKADEIALTEGTGQVGRPAELEGGVCKNVYLDVASLAKARKLGKGNSALVSGSR